MNETKLYLEKPSILLTWLLSDVKGKGFGGTLVSLWHIPPQSFE